MFKFNNLGLALGINLKFYTSLPKGLKLKVRKFLGLILTFVEVTGEKLKNLEWVKNLVWVVCSGSFYRWGGWDEQIFSSVKGGGGLPHSILPVGETL